MSNFFGKYRGTVTNTKDLNKRGRLEVSVPSVLGDQCLWAEPCVPYAGKDIGMFAIPPKGSEVWVEFEGGNRERPIWTGCLWCPNELPKKAAEATTAGEPEKLQMFKTQGVTISVSSLSKGKKYLLLEVAKPVVDKPLKVLFDENGIEINNNNKTTAKLTEKAIELKNGKDSLVTITEESIKLAEKQVEVELNKDKIRLKKSKSIAELTESAFNLEKDKSKVQLSDSGVKMSKTTSAVVEITSSAINLKKGSASVELSGNKVNLNKGSHQTM
ncbi:phage baseplate assembly protein V [Moorena producens JHB]|uniref:Phage baseplate assembly protein V n=1 Tax=Moorena producens (strain JHB) TaxID=1454205 RepID=A0A1D9G119_MOOP1|nr:phage baseplate assembly protein V [Moorena producens]AOY81327.1 phage baseplate assembly protein V [Moorena producens JHB]